MTQKKTIPKKHQNALNIHQRKNVPNRHLMNKKKKVMEEVQKIGGQNALNALNALSVRHLRNVPRCRPMKKKKVTKEIKKKREATKISWPIPHEKLRRRNKRRQLKSRL